MKREAKETVGTVECPFKGCSEVVPVFKMAAADPSNPAKSRHAGKLYCCCPVHGPYREQEWILNNAKLFGAQGPAPAEPPKAPAPASAKPVPQPPPPAPAKAKSSGWAGFGESDD